MARRTRPGRALAIAAIALFPLREPLLVDGRVGIGEWSDAVHAGESVQVRRVRGETFLLVRTDGIRPVQVYLEADDELRLLHASTTLGDARYVRSPEGDFVLARDFIWTLTDPARGGPAHRELAAAQREHLAQKGWVASTAYLGEWGVVEFRLSSALLERPGVRWTVCYLEGGEGTSSLRHYPPGSRSFVEPADELALLEGAAPRRLHSVTPKSPGGSSALRAESGRAAG